jgi:arylsulfatase A-like enzyme
LISIDTLRADHLGAYGYGRDTSPHLDAFAREGVLFEDFVHSGGGTVASHLTMLTSLYPANHGIWGLGDDRVLDPDQITLAEQLRDAEFATAGFTDAGWMKGRFGFAQGFELFDDDGGHLPTILPKVHAWLDGIANRRFFLFLHTYDVHSETNSENKGARLPYACPGDYPSRYTGAYTGDFTGCDKRVTCATRYLQKLTRNAAEKNRDLRKTFPEEDLAYVVGLYDGCINYVDDMLAEFFENLKERGIYDETLIVVTSDHGEEFLEHGGFMHQQQGFEEIIQVPLIIKFPGGAFAGVRVSHLATMTDIMPTVLDIVGIEPNDRAQGVSLMPMVLGGGALYDAVHVLSVLRTPRFSYFGKDQALYDLDADPGQHVNLRDASEHGTRVVEAAKRLAELQDRDRELKRQFQQSRVGQAMDLSPEEIKELQALGYLE